MSRILGRERNPQGEVVVSASGISHQVCWQRNDLHAVYPAPCTIATLDQTSKGKTCFQGTGDIGAFRQEPASTFGSPRIARTPAPVAKWRDIMLIEIDVAY